MEKRTSARWFRRDFRRKAPIAGDDLLIGAKR
jgi:hypothetical protein